jgi:hypothetical protein
MGKMFNHQVVLLRFGHVVCTVVIMFGCAQLRGRKAEDSLREER